MKQAHTEEKKQLQLKFEIAQQNINSYETKLNQLNDYMKDKFQGELDRAKNEVEQLKEEKEEIERRLNIEKKLNEKNFSSDLEEILMDLEEKHREVFVLRHIDGLSTNEVAEVLDINHGTVKSRLFYATKLLASKLQMYNPVNA